MLSFRETQQELKSRGLNAKGNLEQLTERLNTAIAEKLTDYTEQVDEYVPDEPKLIIDAEEINEVVQEIDLNNTLAISAERNRALDLVDQCNQIFQGRAQARYREENPNMIEFRGGMRQANDVTIHQKEKTILALAKGYIARTVNESRPDEVGMFAGKDAADPLNLKNKSPAQIAAMADQLKAIMGE